ncbi:kinase-like domain-containing protein [Hyaloraphidium curvatum]|nr:kinase-like domain-containing protein [Hyaloraphidium curvatum]
MADGGPTLLRPPLAMPLRRVSGESVTSLDLYPASAADTAVDPAAASSPGDTLPPNSLPVASPRRGSAASAASAASKPLSTAQAHHPMQPRGRDRYHSEGPSDGGRFATELSTIEFAWDVVENRHVVLKKVSDAKMSENEIDILNILRATHVSGVVRLIDSFADEDDENRMVLVFPRLHKLSMRSCDLVDVARRTFELLTTLNSLSDLRIAHLDICPANLMVDDEGNLVLIDFGLARQCPEGTEPHPYGRGTPGYVAPELYLNGYSSTDTRPDMYSAGIVVGWWLEPYVSNCDLNLLGSRLLRHNTTTQIQAKLKLLLDNREEPLPDVVYDAADLLFRMLHTDPADRITAADALVHPFALAVADLCGKGSWSASSDAREGVLRRFAGTDWATWAARPKGSPPSRRIQTVRIIDRDR